MTSDHDEAKPRHIGRLVDPMVSDVGDLEPKLEPAESPPIEASSPIEPLPNGAESRAEVVAHEGMAQSSGSHPVRERLLAKAREHAGKHQSEPEARTERFSSLAGLNEELERIARAPTTAPRAKRPRLTGLSPNMIAIFGTFFGLATLATLFATLIHLTPGKRTGTPAVVAVATAEPSARATPASASASATPPPEPTPERVHQKIPGPWRIADSTDASLKHIEGKIGSLPFLKAVQEAGLNTAQAYRLFASLKSEKNLNKCQKTDSFEALIDRASQRLAAFEYIVSKEEVYQAREAEGGLLISKRLDLKVERERVSGAFVLLTDSFADAVEKAGFEPGLATTLNKALEGHTSVEQFHRGDRLRVVAQEVSVLGEFSRYAGIEALEYLPADGGAPIRIYYFQGPQTKSYVTAKGQLTSDRGWRKPIKGAPITSRFNPKRMHPILHIIKPHEGTDFGAPMGTPVGASLYGTVTYIGPLGPNGNFVRIDHKNHYETGYSHLSRFADGLKVGDKVKTLQIVGYVGSTGRSTGPHLHFGVKKDGKFIDPESLHLDALVTLPESERDAFAKVKANYDELLDAIALPEPPTIEPPPAPAPSNEAPDDDVAAEGTTTPIPTSAPAPAAPAPAVAPAPARPAPVAVGEPPRASASSTPPTPKAVPQTPHAASIYLSNRELMKTQAPTDDGEVGE